MRPPFSLIDKIISNDVNRRGIKGIGFENELTDSANLIKDSKYLSIATGFYIKEKKICETDGLNGTILLGKTLKEAGKEFSVITDKYSNRVLEKGFEKVGFQPEIITMPLAKDLFYNKEKFIEDFISVGNDLLISIERTGKATDGRYYNIRGSDISMWTAEIDEIFLEFNKLNKPTIGIGDAGNEIGMGKIFDKIRNEKAVPEKIITTVKTSKLIFSGMSDWGAYGLAASFSSLYKKNMLASKEELAIVLNTISEAGAVDGITTNNSPSVDGFPLFFQQKVLNALNAIINKELYGQN